MAEQKPADRPEQGQRPTSEIKPGWFGSGEKGATSTTVATGGQSPSGQKYVVIHSRVGSHDQGDVVSASQFPEGTDFERLKKAGALREATGDEESQEKVTIVAGTQEGTQSFEDQIAEKTRLLEQTLAEKADLQAQLSQQRADQFQQQQAQQQTTAATTLVKAKDDEITRLKQQAQQLQQENEALKAQRKK